MSALPASNAAPSPPPLPSPRTRPPAAGDSLPPSSPGGCAPHRPRTISVALRAAGAVQSPPAYREWAPYLRMTARFLGEEPSFYGVLSLSPAAIRTHVGLFARMFHAPAVDMRVPGFLSPELRRLAFISASDAFSCDYCKDPAGASLAELADDVEEVVGPRALEVVKAVVAFSGALNTVMDVQGVTLEAEVQAFASQHLPTRDGSQFRPNGLHRNPALEANEPWEGEQPELLGLAGKVRNVKKLMGTMPAAVSGIKYEMLQLYKGIPYRGAKLQEWVDERLGYGSTPWFGHIIGTELRRAFCFGLRENLLVAEAQGAREWSLPVRLCFLYLFARITEAPRLADAAVALMPASRYERGVGSAKHELSAFVSTDSKDLYPCVAAGRHLVNAASLKTDNISPDLVAELTETCSPEAILELASLISFYELWRRMDLLFTPADNVSVDN